MSRAIRLHLLILLMLNSHSCNLSGGGGGSPNLTIVLYIAFIVESQLEILMFIVTPGVVSHVQHDLISKESHF